MLFATNGPVLSLVGQLRYSELLILLIGLINARHVKKSIRKMEWRIGLLFLLTALTYLIMDLFNHGIKTSTVSRVGSYMILCALLFSIKWIIGDSKAKLVAALLGFSLSFLIVLILNVPVPSASYHVAPWRLGLQFAMTLMVCTLIFQFPRYYSLGLVVLSILIFLHFWFGSRSFALITLIVLLVALWVRFNGRDLPIKPSGASLLRTIGYCAMATFLVFRLMQSPVFLSILPNEMQNRMEVQLQNPFGLFAAARPDVATAIHGIFQRPMTGFGSSTVDPEVLSFYARVAAASYFEVEDAIYLNLINREWSSGTPSHSHVFGAWVDAGIVAALSWMAVLLFSFSILAQVTRYRSPLTPLATLVAATLIWDVLFSPGPTRLTVALLLVVQFFVKQYLVKEATLRR